MRRPAILSALACLVVSSAFGQAPSPVPAAGTEKLSHQKFMDWLFYNDQGWVALQNEDLSHAETMFGRAIETARGEAAIDPRLMARSYADLAWVLHRQGRDAEAEPLARWALTVREKLLGPKVAAVAQTVYTLGAIQVNLNRFDEAETLFAKALSITESISGSNDIKTAGAAEDLARVYVFERKYAKARPLYLRSISIYRKIDPDSVEQVVPIEALAGIALAEGKLDDAEARIQRARDIIDKLRYVDPALRAGVLRRQAEIIRKNGRTDEAKRLDSLAEAALKPPAEEPENR